MTVQTAIELLKSEVDALYAENARLGNIKATIRVNARRHGASEGMIERLVNGEESFVDWIIRAIERHAPSTHEHTANEEARHGNRDALEQVTRERDRLRVALALIEGASNHCVTTREHSESALRVALHSIRDRARAALEDTHD